MPMVALWALVVSSLGAAIAAMVPLPDHYNQQHISLVILHQPAVLVHGIASFANSAGFVIAAALWGIGRGIASTPSGA